MSVTVMEITLLIVSAVGFVISFLIPDSQEKPSGVDEEAAREEIGELIRQETGALRSHVEEVVEESVGSAMERTERSLERLSNEKIMAVNEYSDTVMREINKSHEEVMFLYDMLNNKHENLKKTVTEASRAVKVMQDTIENMESIRTQPIVYPVPVPGQPEEAEAEIPEKPARTRTRSTEKKSETKTAPVRRKRKAEPEEIPVQMPLPQELPKEEPQDEADVQEESRGSLAGNDSRNSNEKILELHAQGRSNVAIAKELGLGVGEVKLVIGLYKNL